MRKVRKHYIIMGGCRRKGHGKEKDKKKWMKSEKGREGKGRRGQGNDKQSSIRSELT
jgi:hypothetical protein